MKCMGNNESVVPKSDQVQSDPFESVPHVRRHFVCSLNTKHAEVFSTFLNACTSPLDYFARNTCKSFGHDTISFKRITLYNIGAW